MEEFSRRKARSNSIDDILEVALNGTSYDDAEFEENDDEDDEDDSKETLFDRRFKSITKKNLFAYDNYDEIYGRMRSNSMSMIPIKASNKLSISIPPPGRPRAGSVNLGIYSRSTRRAKLDKFFEKRKHRIWQKKVKYDVRKVIFNI